MAYSAQQPTMPRARCAAWMFWLCLVACTQPQIVIDDLGSSAENKPRDGGPPVYVDDDRCGDEGCLSCDRTQECDEGELCQQNRCVPEPYCGDGRTDEGETCDDGNSIDTDVCVACHLAFCGDGKIRKGHEECEIGSQGWTSKNCELRTCKRRDYMPCEVTSGVAECPHSNACRQGVCAPMVCPSKTCSGLANVCPEVPGFASRIVEDNCFIACGEKKACPKGLVCSAEGLCVGRLHD